MSLFDEYFLALIIGRHFPILFMRYCLLLLPFYGYTYFHLYTTILTLMLGGVSLMKVLLSLVTFQSFKTNLEFSTLNFSQKITF